MKIGITFNGNKDKLFLNGICFNVIIWYDFFENCGYEPYFIHTEDNIDKTELSTIKILNKDYNIISYDHKKSSNIMEINEFLELEIIFLIGLEESSLLKISKTLGKKIIYVCLGNTYNLDIQNIIDIKYNTYCTISDYLDEMWISPHFEFSKEYLEIRNKVPVYVCPYIWDPRNLINFELDKKVINDFSELNVAIMEPNLSFGKNCLIPISICENSIDEIKSVYAFCTYKIKDNQFFNKFVRKLDLFKQKKITFEDKIPIVKILSKYCNCVVSCVENWDLNYLFLECFYLGIPLIHNSKILKDYGYYYPDLKVNEAKNYFKYIKENHNAKEYIKRHREVIDRYSINNPEYIYWVKSKVSGDNLPLLERKKNCILTCSIGDRPFFKFCKKSIEIYAKKVNADFIIADDIDLPDNLNNIKIGRNNNKAYLKKIIFIRMYLEKYERVLWIDDTCIINPKCPNLFELVPKDYVAAPSETFQLYSGYRLAATTLKELPNGKYKNIKLTSNDALNTGIFLYNQDIKKYLSDEFIFKYSELFSSVWTDQLFILVILQFYSIKKFTLDGNFNKMTVYDEHESILDRESFNKKDKIIYLDKNLLNSNSYLYEAFIYHITSYYNSKERYQTLENLYNVFFN